MNILRTPGHAEIKGNEIAETLAKEASKETEVTQYADNIYTKLDIKRAAGNNVLKKWQHRWGNGESGKHYYRFHNNIKVTYH